MTTPIVKIQKNSDAAVMPQYAHLGENGGDSGADLFAVEDTEWQPITNKDDIIIGYKAIVKTGLFMELPTGYELQVRPRGGNAGKFNMSVLNTPGTVDNGYRGEIMVIVYCLGKPLGDYVNKIPKGSKIAQAVITKFEQAQFVISDDLSETKRGAGALNSTQTFVA